jgi:type IV secretory pathway ATPase VirB11/archaellum biosynthesis ATPase
MRVRGGDALIRLVSKRKRKPPPAPLLLELLQKPEGKAMDRDVFPFSYKVVALRDSHWYFVWSDLPTETVYRLRSCVQKISSTLRPEDVEPLSFHRLVEVLSEAAATELAREGLQGRTKELSELAAYEAIGLSRVLALAKDPDVSEFFVDSDATPVYLDHVQHGRCETSIFLTESERLAVQTHVDTFGGYTIDYKTPSLKNDLEVSGAILRISLDLEPVSVNRFALDARRLNPVKFSLDRLIGLGVLSAEAATVLVGWLASGGNLTIIGETGTGKTTLLNSLDERLDPRLRRLYIEDAVETMNLLPRGYHQMKLKVDPFERGFESDRTKGNEIVKALHRSPDIMILSEIQSEEHSSAFFHALAAGIRGMQTFHATTIEQALRRWVNLHSIPEDSLLDLGLLVQMARPDRLRAQRFVQRIAQVVEEEGKAKVVDLFLRKDDLTLEKVGEPRGEESRWASQLRTGTTSDPSS